MSEKSRSERKDRKKTAVLLGLAFDGDDGRKRITRGENFYLIGGAKDTHEQMQEKAIRINEHLAKRGKRLEDISKEDFREIIEEV